MLTDESGTVSEGDRKMEGGSVVESVGECKGKGRAPVRYTARHNLSKSSQSLSIYCGRSTPGQESKSREKAQ
ncbi:BQ5605_C007g04777 [Microbotryum silenes-dioicae]|uniref:BQ5605_C007g04777 protein n=1 Tax=Microbotryum silenes-dioicae TaxID=796604 RepID=A0A2X0M7V9_9BASI|nr:BQ5605_C007g04777 [Microbotryum silenes-dioicae]